MPRSKSGRYNFAFREKHIVANFLSSHTDELSKYSVDELLGVLKPLVGKELTYANVRNTANELGINWKPKRVITKTTPRASLTPRIEELEDKVAALELAVEELVAKLGVGNE